MRTGDYLKTNVDMDVTQEEAELVERLTVGNMVSNNASGSSTDPVVKLENGTLGKMTELDELEARIAEVRENATDLLNEFQQITTTLTIIEAKSEKKTAEEKRYMAPFLGDVKIVGEDSKSIIEVFKLITACEDPVEKELPKIIKKIDKTRLAWGRVQKWAGAHEVGPDVPETKERKPADKTVGAKRTTWGTPAWIRRQRLAMKKRHAT